MTFTAPTRGDAPFSGPGFPGQDGYRDDRYGDHGYGDHGYGDHGYGDHGYGDHDGAAYGVDGRRGSMASLRIALAALAVFAAVGGVGMLAWRQLDLARAPLPPVLEEDVAVEPNAPARLDANARKSTADIAAYPSSGTLVDTGYIYGERATAIPLRIPGAQAQQSPQRAPQVTMVVPLPTANPITASRVVAPLDEDGRVVIVPLPLRNPLPGRRETQVASAPTAPVVPDTVVTPAPPSEEAVALPTPGSGYALYDIKGQTVYMPNGDRLEAHSGYGDKFDDTRYVHVRMLGPTPPNVYKLAPREALFHGVEALRMHPVGKGKMYGRTGILTHSYLLGPRGDSNGCVSFKDYEKFLAAYKRGEVQQLVVVASLPPGVAPPQNPLLSWLKLR